MDSIHHFQAMSHGAIRLSSSTTQFNKMENLMNGLYGLLESFILFAVFAGFIAGGVLVALLQTDNLALSNTDKCGLYVPSPGKHDNNFTITTTYEFHAQMESAAYADACYGTGNSDSGCNYFASQDIQFTEEHNAYCPFPDGSMCYGGSESSYHLTTGPVPARALGINTKRRYEFQREATFTPLNMNGTYITLHQNGSHYTFSYRYGMNVSRAGGPHSNITWQTFTHGDFFEKVPSYSMG